VRVGVGVILNRYWVGPPSPGEPWTGDVVRQFFQVIDWDDDSIDPKIRSWHGAGAVQVRVEDAVRHRANMLRWLILWRNGGIWADHDVIPLRPWDDLLVGSFIGGYAAGKPNSAVVYLTPGHPVAAAMLGLIAAAPPSTTARCLDVSGDGRVASGAVPALRVEPFLFDRRGTVVGAPWAVHQYRTSQGR
jgi:hypothetical protein